MPGQMPLSTALRANASYYRIWWQRWELNPWSQAYETRLNADSPCYRNLVERARLERAKSRRDGWFTATSNCRYTTTPLENSAGIEPALHVLQTCALPLGQPFKEQGASPSGPIIPYTRLTNDCGSRTRLCPVCWSLRVDLNHCYPGTGRMFCR